MALELRHLRYFVALAEELHYARAARRLHLAQPALSQQIQRLEADLGITLFIRGPTGTRLTDAGAALLDDARATLAQADRAVQRAQQIAHGESGSLRVGFSASASADLLFADLYAFRGAHPDVRLIVEERRNGQLAEDLTNYRVDLALLAILNPPEGNIDPISMTTVHQEPFVLALGLKHPLAGEASVDLGQLAEDRFAFFARETGGWWHDALLTLCHNAGFAPNITETVHDQSSQLALVASNLSVAIVPASTRRLRTDAITYHPLTAPSPVITSTLAWSLDSPSPVLRRFLNSRLHASRNR